MNRTVCVPMVPAVQKPGPESWPSLYRSYLAHRSPFPSAFLGQPPLAARAPTSASREATSSPVRRRKRFAGGLRSALSRGTAAADDEVVVMRGPSTRPDRVP